jgi:dipeptidyl aminopeptidase/acylaminoacyl peptidase
VAAEWALDRRITDAAEKDSETWENLTYLCDVIGPRLTGSTNLRRANDWAATLMQKYGLVNVHQEPWELAEGWQRGPATARIVEPDNGRSVSLTSWGWYPGTKGAVQGDVVIVKADNTKDLAAYQGKLKAAIVLVGAPRRLLPLTELDKPEGSPVAAYVEAPGRNRTQLAAFYRELNAFLFKEGAVAALVDAGKPFSLLFTTGSWQGKDRPSAINLLPVASVAHDHYELLYRLAARPAPARTRLEIDIQNRFLPGPVIAHNTVGEIRGGGRPEEVVVVAAHLDSWDLGQGAMDNGAGTAIVLETARILARCGTAPRRTVRFILFTGEEQGLHGSRAYVEQHKAEMPNISACLVLDTGTGKVTGVGSRSRPGLRLLLESELGALKKLGVKNFAAGFTEGSDHASFDKAGVPGFALAQEVAGYRLAHHSQADTLDRAEKPKLVQCAQVMALSAMRIANLDRLLPRETKDKDPKAEYLELDDLDKMVHVSDARIAPDGKSIACIVTRVNLGKNRHDSELVLVDVASGKERTLTFERDSVDQPRWSPSGDRLAFLAKSTDSKTQVFVLPMNGGEARRVTDADNGVLQYAWKPDGSDLAYVTPDDAPNKNDIDKHKDAFEVGNNDFLTNAAPTPAHLWLISAEGDDPRRLTSGSWGLSTSPPPGPASSPICWTPDGKSIVFVRQESPHDGNSDQTTVQVSDVASGKMRGLTGRKLFESFAQISPKGDQVAYVYPRDDDYNNVNDIYLSPTSGGPGRNLTRALDRNFYQAEWFPDGQSVLVGANDGTRVSFWVQPLNGPARKLDLGAVNPEANFGLDASISSSGAIAFVGAEAHRPSELYYLESPAAKPRRLTDFNKFATERVLGKVESFAWKGPDGFDEDGVLTFPPRFTPDKKYPLVLVIHGGPTGASLENFEAFSQLLAGRGYIVFEPNYRGSDNRGNAYQRAITNDAGDGPGRDVMSGLAALRQRGYIDEKRIAVSGWSYGGFMTAWLIGHYHDWKTAVVGAAVTDHDDQYNLSDGNVLERYSFGGSPWTGNRAKAYRDQSPITYARDIKTPTLILAATGDSRVPITQSYRLYHALQDNNVPVRFVAYPVTGHYPSDPIRVKDLYERWIGWLDEYLR